MLSPQKKIKREIRAKNGNFAGILSGNIFHKKVQGSKHKFRKIGINGAWGIDWSIIHEDLPKNTVVRILDHETQIIYQTPLQTYKDKGTILHFKEGTKDHNTQVFLPLEYFTKIGETTETQEKFPNTG